MSTSFMLCVLLALVASLVTAIPLSLVPREDIQPPITLPTAGTVWTVGSKQKITWDTSDVPSADSQTADLILGWLDSTGENLQLGTPLANDVQLITGEATITVPDFPERDIYIVCLLGSSGNVSPQFTIKGGSGSASPPASSSTVHSGGPSTVSSSVAPPTVVVSSSQTGPSTIEPSSSPSGVSSTTPSPSPRPSSTSSTNSSGTSLPQSNSPSPSGSGNTSGASSMFTTNNMLLSAITASLVAFFI